MNARGHYGVSVGQVVQPATTVYVEREQSTAAHVLGALGIIGVALWAHHQSRQIKQLYQTTGAPYQSFTASAGASLRGLVDRIRPKGKNS